MQRERGFRAGTIPALASAASSRSGVRKVCTPCSPIEKLIEKLSAWMLEWALCGIGDYRAYDLHQKAATQAVSHHDLPVPQCVGGIRPDGNILL